jgi:DNA-binding NarL/FixJ family response regulator
VPPSQRSTPSRSTTHILQKLDLRDRVQAVVLAYRTGAFEKVAD